MRQQRDQGDLPQIGGLAGHVRPGQNVNQLAGRETRVVGHKRFVACLLHNRMTPSRDGDGGAVIKLGPAVATLQRDFRQRRIHIQQGQPLCQATDLVGARRKLSTYAPE